MSVLESGYRIGPYQVEQFIKDGEVNETYRMADTPAQGKPRFMKLFDLDRFPAQIKPSDGKIAEIEYLKQLSHPSIIKYIDSGHIEVDGHDYQYMICDYFQGRLLSEMLSYQDCPFTLDEALNIYRELLLGLRHMHTQGFVHNDITPRNVMYDPSSKEIQIIDMGHITRANDTAHNYITEDLELLYQSPEGIRHVNHPSGDVFSATAVFYAILTGSAPWLSELPEADVRDRLKVKTALHAARKKPLSFAGAFCQIPDWLKDVVSAALALKEQDRLSIDAVLNCLKQQKSPFDAPKKLDGDQDTPKPKIDKVEPDKHLSAMPEQKGIPGDDAKKIKGNGFADVAGMDELKDLLSKKVLFILKDKEKAEKYRLTAPNGMLLYGPPGCGKTYFAEKFAEESGFNYKLIKASDLGSIYIHGSQGKIAELFQNARKQAPVILCFDEFDAMVPDRSSRSGEHQAGEVNEFLSQLNNCSKDGIFVIGTTNRPELIDNAVLRKGRLDISVYIPEPDCNTRKLMFDLYLKERPCTEINTEELAALTDRFVASDIAFIVNDAAMIAAFRDEPITQQGLIDSIKSTRPSLNDEVLSKYARERQRMENTGASARPKVGFVQF